MEELGRQADQKASLSWSRHVLKKHRVAAFRPPFTRCSCGWISRADPESGVLRQRDFLLDEFYAHFKKMVAEKQRLKAIEKAERAQR